MWEKKSGESHSLGYLQERKKCNPNTDFLCFVRTDLPLWNQLGDIFL